jgi:hypothetical protein
MRRLIFSLLLCLLGLGALSAEETALRRDAKVYLPGDMVRIVVSAPPDTAKIVAVMPDRQRLSLSYDSRNAIWQGQWEVPLNMIKGTYAADLMATDVSGQTFTGQTTPFVISEPTLITLIDLVGQGEVALREGVAPAEDLSARQIAAEARQLAAEAKKRVEELDTLLQKRRAPLASPRPTPRTTARPVTRPTLRPAPKLAPKPTAARPSTTTKEAELMVAARYYLARQDYPRAQAELKKLLNLRPKDGQIKGLVDRVEMLIKVKEAE